MRLATHLLHHLELECGQQSSFLLRELVHQIVVAKVQEEHDEADKDGD